MSNCIIHVGMHSTGTGAIQASLDGLDDKAFLFPQLNGNTNHSLPILTAFSDTPVRPGVLARHGGSEEQVREHAQQTRKDLIAAIAALDGRTLVLSGEGIAGLSPKEMGRFRDFLKRRWLEPVVYAYIRKPAAFMTIALQQRIKDSVVKDGKVGGSAQSLYRNYREKFSKFDNVFGRENVKLRLFAEENFPERGVVADFLAWTGIQSVTAKPRAPDEIVSRNAMALLYQYHQHHAELKLPALRGPAAQRLSSFLSAGGGETFRLSPKLVDEVLESKADDLAWMEERLGASLKEEKGQPRAGDFTSEEDLLAPVEGAREKLLAALAEKKADLTYDQMGNVYRLMAAFAKGDPASRPAKPAGKAKQRQGAAAKPATDPNDMMAPVDEPRPRGIAAALSPRPMVNARKNLMVLWSPKSACTTAYVWFSHVSGFLPQVRKHAAWPHKHRQERYERSRLYFESVKSDLTQCRTVRIIRDPYGRAVSIYRHALQTRFADKALQDYSKGRQTFDEGMSFLDFLDFTATLDMKVVDIHFRPQFHPYEGVRKPDRVINISKEDLFAGLNAFERDGGLPETDFEQFNWLHDMEGKRKAKPAAMEGEAFDRKVFNRHQVVKLGEFPSYEQLLTPEAKRRIEEIYKADFDAYRDFL